MDRYTPKSVDLQNCLDVKETWLELDAKYASSANVAGTLVNDFVSYVCKVRSDESKIVELKGEVMKLYNDLKEVEKHQQLSSNEWLLTQIVKKMPQQFQVRFSEQKAFGMAVEVTNLWEVTSSFFEGRSPKLGVQLHRHYTQYPEPNLNKSVKVRAETIKT